jgi:predicted RNase H-like nuclease (RuvC/YqgF family)
MVRKLIKIGLWALLGSVFLIGFVRVFPMHFFRGLLILGFFLALRLIWTKSKRRKRDPLLGGEALLSLIQHNRDTITRWETNAKKIIRALEDLRQTASPKEATSEETTLESNLERQHAYLSALDRLNAVVESTGSSLKSKNDVFRALNLTKNGSSTGTPSGNLKHLAKEIRMLEKKIRDFSKALENLAGNEDDLQKIHTALKSME